MTSTPLPKPPGRRHKWSLSMEVIWTPLRMLINIANESTSKVRLTISADGLSKNADSFCHVTIKINEMFKNVCLLLCFCLQVYTGVL